MKFKLVHKVTGAVIPFEMKNGNVTSEIPLPVPAERIVGQYRRGLIMGCSHVTVGDYELKI